MATAPTTDELKRYCLARARKAVKDGERYPAIRNYRAALNYDCRLSDEPEWKIHLELADVYANAKFHDQAIQHYECVLQLSPSAYEAEVRANIGVSHHDAHRYSEAIAELERARDGMPARCTERVLLCLASSHSKRKETDDLEKALEYYDQLSSVPEEQRETRDWEIENHRGFACLENGDHDAALFYLKQACRLPYCISQGDVRNNMGRAYLEQGRYPEAQEQFSLVLSETDINPTTEGYAHMCLGDIFVEEKERYQAANEYASARRLLHEARMSGIASEETIAEFMQHIDDKEKILGVNFMLRCPETSGVCQRSVSSGQGNQVFVSMPFGKTKKEQKHYNALYDDAIAKAVKGAGFRAIRVDRSHDRNRTTVFCEICVRIQSARFVVADVTGGNPNVMHEVGLAQAIGKMVLPICKEGADIPFNIRSFHCTHYDAEADLGVALRKLIRDVTK